MRTFRLERASRGRPCLASQAGRPYLHRAMNYLLALFLPPLSIGDDLLHEAMDVLEESMDAALA